MAFQRTKRKKVKVSQDRLIFLGNDLAKAIEDAAWQDEYGDKNLFGPTMHMQMAVETWKEATR